MANGSITLTEVDFLSYKNQLISWLKEQEEFRDFDFESSNINVLVELLAYNTYVNGFYLSMIMSEAFLDSAQMKSSIISHAKELNYVPRSYRSAVAAINLTFKGEQPTYLLEKGQSFSAVIKSNTYSFSLANSVLLTSANGTFSANLNIYEGSYFSDTYIYNRSDENQRLVLTNPTVDTSSLTVVVYEDGSLVGENFRRANTLLGLTETSKVFFLQQAENELYEVSFGDGVVGYRPKDGARVVLDYRVTNGSDGNGARLFTINFNPGPTEDASFINVQTVSVSSSGANAESLESIRFTAPRHFQVQERAVTDTDFVDVLREQFPEIASVSVYGGENLKPPRYGKVVVSAVIDGVDKLPDSKKRAYENFLENRMALTMGVIFREPIRAYLSVDSEVTYNINQSTLTPDSMKTLVAAAIKDYSDENLGVFNARFRYSKFCSAIDDVHASIVGNQTDVTLYKKIAPLVGEYQNMEIDFGLPVRLTTADKTLSQPSIELRSIYSSPFTINGARSWFEDDGGGRVYIVTSSDGRDYYAQLLGTVDYESGIVRLTSFRPDSYVGNHIKVFCRTRDKDIVSDPATILEIEDDEIHVNVVPVRE